MEFAHVENVAVAYGIGHDQLRWVGKLQQGCDAVLQQGFGCVEHGSSGGRGGSNVVYLYLFVGCSRG